MRTETTHGAGSVCQTDRTCKVSRNQNTRRTGESWLRPVNYRRQVAAQHVRRADDAFGDRIDRPELRIDASDCRRKRLGCSPQIRAHESCICRLGCDYRAQ
jgi:hypothetical protein